MMNELFPRQTGTLKKHNFKNLTYLKIFLIWYRLKGGENTMNKQRFEILELIDEDDGGISYLVSDGKTLIEVHGKKEYAIKLKRILDNEW